MEISITDLNFQPDHFTSGKKNATLTFKGCIEATNLNPVSMTCVLNDDDPLFFIDENGDRVKQIEWTEDLGVKMEEYSKDIVIQVSGARSAEQTSRVRITGTPRQGRPNNDFQTITYKR